MSDWHKRISLLANIAIIVVAILLGVVLSTRYLFPTSPTPETARRAQIKSGTKLSLPGVDWGRSSKTLLMALSTNCRYCTESAPFYQRLAQEKSKRGDVRLVAALPQGLGEAQKYLDDHDITVDQIIQTVPGAAYATATPTLIIVDRAGSVVESWVGKLPPQKEAEVLNRLLGTPSAAIMRLSNSREYLKGGRVCFQQKCV